MQTTRMFTLLFLIVSVVACNRGPSATTQRAVTLIREGNELLAKSTKSTEEWGSEYGRAFRPDSREKFPANREQLRVSAGKIVKGLDETTKLSNSAIEKFEQAFVLMKDGPQRQGMVMLVSSIRKGAQINELHKSQVQLVSDEKIVDAKTLNARFQEIMDQVMVIKRQADAEFSEGRRLMGM